MKHTESFEIVRAQAEDAAALLEYLKIIGGETDNLSFGAEGVPLDEEAERAYLDMQAKSHDHIQLFAKVNGEIIGTASLNRKPNRMHHRAEFGISLKKAWWGCGAATVLAHGVLDFARDAGIEQVNLEVRSDNKRAIALYEKLGFRRLCTFPAFFKINEERIDFDLMNLDLVPTVQDEKPDKKASAESNGNKLIGCCGLDCAACDAIIATVTNDNALREKTAALWTKLNGVPITAEMIHCTGCRTEGVKTPFCDKLCPVHNCVREKGFATCADCPQADGCPTLGRIAANSPFVLENLKRLRETE